MAGRTTNDILWRFLADTKSLERGSRRAQGDFRDVDRSSDRMQQGLGTATKALGALGLAMGVSEIKDWVFEAAGLARTAVATATSFDIVFGPAADSLRDKLDDTRRAMGLGKDEMEAMLLTTGTLATGMGISETAAADFSGKLFTLAGDLAAFNPAAGSTEEALNGLQAAVRGEFDPLERFGVKLSAAAVNAEALRATGKKTTAELTAQDKALATLTLSLAATTKQTGALERAEESGGREIEKMEARARDLRIEFGSKLVPIIDDVAGTMGNLTGSIDEGRGRSFLLLDAIAVLTGGMRDLTSASEDTVSTGIDPFTDAVAGATDWLGKALGFIPPVSQSLHDQADAWRDDASGINTTSGAAGDLTGAMDTLLRQAQNSRQGMINAGKGADDMGDDLNDAEDDAWDLARALGELGKFGYRTFPTAQPSVAVPDPQPSRPTGSTSGSTAGAQNYDHGGIVSGPKGAPQLAIVHGGEQVLTPEQQRRAPHSRDTHGNGNAAGAGTVVIQVEAGISDPMAVADAIVEAIRLYEQTNGPVLT